MPSFVHQQQCYSVPASFRRTIVFHKDLNPQNHISFAIYVNESDEGCNIAAYNRSALSTKQHVPNAVEHFWDSVFAHQLFPRCQAT